MKGVPEATRAVLRQCAARRSTEYVLFGTVVDQVREIVLAVDVSLPPRRQSRRPSFRAGWLVQ